MTNDKNGTTADVAVIPPHAMDLIDRLGIKFADPNAIAWRIADKQANATSLEELLKDDGPLGLRDHMDEPFIVRDVEYLPSRFPANPLYAIIHAVNDNGEPVTYTSGATSVIIMLAKGMQMGWLDGQRMKAVWSTDQPGPDGNRPYRLTTA